MKKLLRNTALIAMALILALVPSGHAGARARTYKENIRYSKDRLVIPSVGTDIRLKKLKKNEYTLEKAQRYVDQMYACHYYWTEDAHEIVAAHKTTSFGGIKKAVPKKTVAYLDGKPYVCIDKYNGQNLTHFPYLLDDHGEFPVWGEEEVMMYTCNQDSTHVTMTIWHPASGDGLKITSKKEKLEVGDKYNFNLAKKVPGSKYVWSSSDEDIATVNSKNGVAKGIAPGKATIYCKVTLPTKQVMTVKASLIVSK